MEKLEKLQTTRQLLEHEREAQREAAVQLQARFDAVEAQIGELRNALAHQPNAGMRADVFHRQVLIERTERTALAGDRFDADLFFETRRQKQAALMVAKDVIEAFGNVHLRDLYTMLQQKGVEVSSPQRLSQILSESEQFEADRAKGWSLKR